MTPAEAEREMRRAEAEAAWSTEDPAFAAAPPPGAPSLVSEDRVELLEIVARLLAWWRVGLVTALVVFAIGTVAILRLHSKYEADVTIMPRDGSGGGGNSLTALFTGVRPSPTFLPLLTSRSLEDDVVRRTGLMTRMGTHSEAAARGELTGMTRILPLPDGLIRIVIRSADAQQAVAIADAYVDALRSLQEHMAETESELQLHVYQQQLQKEKDALAAAEQDLERTQVGSGVVQAETQTQAGLSQIAGTQAEINGLEVQLAALLQGSTEQNPEVQRLRSQIGKLRAQERALQIGSGNGGAGTAAPAGRLPAVNLLIARKQREVRYHEQLVNSLASHFDGIRLGEASLGDSFNVLDRAVLPEAPTWPPRKNFFTLLAAAALFAGLVAMLVAIVVDRVLASPVQRGWLREIGRSVRFGPRRAGAPQR